MAFNAKAAVTLMEDLRIIATRLQEFPQMQPIAQEILLPVLNGKQERRVGTPHHTISAARRKAMSLAARKRWAKAKKMGKRSLVGV